MLPEGFATTWHWAHAPQQTHGCFSFVCAPETDIFCNLKKKAEKHQQLNLQALTHSKM